MEITTDSGESFPHIDSRARNGKGKNCAASIGVPALEAARRIPPGGYADLSR